jgi:hypothetical protein
VIWVRVIEHQCQRVRCPQCGKRPRGELPSARRSGEPRDLHRPSYTADRRFHGRFHGALATVTEPLDRSRGWPSMHRRQQSP